MSFIRDFAGGNHTAPLLYLNLHAACSGPALLPGTWRYRLGVRTEDSQSSNPGSIPGSATNLFQALSKLNTLDSVRVVCLQPWESYSGTKWSSFALALW